MSVQVETERRENPVWSTGALVVVVISAIAAVALLLLVIVGLFLFWSYRAIEIPQNANAIAPATQAQQDFAPATAVKEHPDESIPGIVDNLDRRMDQFDELGAPVDREKNEKLKAILGDLTGSEVD